MIYGLRGRRPARKRSQKEREKDRTDPVGRSLPRLRADAGERVFGQAVLTLSVNLTPNSPNFQLVRHPAR